MEMKRYLAMLLMLCMALSAACLAEEAQEGMHFSTPVWMLTAPGATLDAAALLESAPEEVVYTSSDEAVATVSEAGLVTAVGEGVATIVAVSAADAAAYAYMDVVVHNYLGTYAGSKNVEAMGCDIEIEIILAEDGTFVYARAPMRVAGEGGGEMPGLDDAGTYAIEGGEIVFVGEALGEFRARFALVDGVASLQGKLPTGGPATDMELVQTEQAELDADGAADSEESAGEEDAQDD